MASNPIYRFNVWKDTVQSTKYCNVLNLDLYSINCIYTKSEPKSTPGFLWTYPHNKHYAHVDTPLNRYPRKILESYKYLYTASMTHAEIVSKQTARTEETINTVLSSVALKHNMFMFELQVMYFDDLGMVNPFFVGMTSSGDNELIKSKLWQITNSLFSITICITF